MTKNQEKTKEALERIDNALANIETDADWLQFLGFSARFYRYSANNVLLIYAQRPDASYVKGFKAWHELGRYVRKGAKGIQILAPCFKKVEDFDEPENKAEYQDKKGEKVTMRVLSGFTVKYVFDLADTDGDDSRLPVLVKGLSGNGEYENQMYESLKAVISTKHKVQEVTGIGAKGTYNRETGVISVRSDLEALQKVKTILHEFAHANDFAMNPDEEISRNRRELIAESVAYVVALRLGLDTSRYTMGYLQSWLKDKDELKTVADTVQKVSAAIIETLAASSDAAFAFLKEDSDNEG